MNVVVFEDDRVEALHPITLARPAYSIQCGAARLRELLGEFATAGRWWGLVRSHLRALQAEDDPSWHAAQRLPSSETLCVNAALVPSRGAARLVAEWLERPGPGMLMREGRIVLARLHGEQFERLPWPTEPAEWYAALQNLELPVQQAEENTVDWGLFGYPHDVIQWNMRIIGENLEARIASGGYEQVRDGVFLAHGAALSAEVVTDTSDGPILLDEGATVGPFSLLSGPVYIGARSRILEHAAIKDAVSIGHTAKIGGEVEAAVVEPYTNKQHHGFLGHAYLGSWINLGAGTCNSDLKNTYGTVNMEYGRRKVGTGMQFLGCVMGDYAKSAINTGIFTGKVIGVCSMVYGFVTTNVPSFINHARLFGQIAELPPEVMIATQRRMFARRKVEQRACDEQLIRDMYDLTRHERALPDEPLAF